MEKGLIPNRLVPRLRASVDEFRGLLPVVAALRNTALKERHWAKVNELVGTVLVRDAAFTLQVSTASERSCTVRLCMHWACCRCWV